MSSEFGSKSRSISKDCCDFSSVSLQYFIEFILISKREDKPHLNNFYILIVCCGDVRLHFHHYTLLKHNEAQSDTQTPGWHRQYHWAPATAIICVCDQVSELCSFIFRHSFTWICKLLGLAKLPKAGVEQNWYGTEHHCCRNLFLPKYVWSICSGECSVAYKYCVCCILAVIWLLLIDYPFQNMAEFWKIRKTHFSF